MAIPKQVSFVTFDVYGTLIDWETGVYEAFQKEAERDGFTVDRDELLQQFHQVRKEKGLSRLVPEADDSELPGGPADD